MKWTRGDKLSQDNRREVLNAYGYRITRENLERLQRMHPIWWSDCKPRPGILVPSDADWLKDRAFAITNLGTLDKRVNHYEPHYKDLASSP